MISAFFIERPVFASVLSVIIVIAGLVALKNLPIEQYPQIVPPEISVSTTYLGASAETITKTVAAPLEQAINGAKGLIYMKSSSSNSGVFNLTITFEIGTDPDEAAVDVNNRVQTALSLLPTEVTQQGIKIEKKSSSILQVITLFSPDNSQNTLFISNYALLNVVDELKRIKGIGNATIFGAKDYAMRIWLNPEKLAQYNLTPNDVAEAIREQNTQFSLGQVGQEPLKKDTDFTYTLNTKGTLTTPEEFENIILRTDSKGTALYLKNVARVELGSVNYSFVSKYNSKPSIAIGIYLQPEANALETTKAVKEKMEALSKNFPQGIAYSIPFDTTKFVKVSIDEVVKTFIEAIVLVIIVVFLFLQNFRATLIPLLAVPVSLIGTFAVMYALGFSINLLTLFGMVLAIGIVVDDAIVVLENVERIMRIEHLSAREATFKAMTEVTTPIIAIVLVLCSVFIPVGFLGGLTGIMYKQFAVTIAVSVIISGFVALTLTPALCALLIKHSSHEPHWILKKFNTQFDRLTEFYLKQVKFILNHGKMSLGVFLGMIGIIIILFIRIPGSLAPEEDQGYIFSVPILLSGSSLKRTDAVTEELTKRFLSHPVVEDVVSFAGFDFFSFTPKTSTGVLFMSFKDWKYRTASEYDARNLVKTFMGMAGDIKESITLAFNPPPIMGMSTTGGFDLFLQNRGKGSIKDLAMQAAKLTQAANKRPELTQVRANLSVDTPQYSIEINYQKIKALNLSISDVFSTMQSTFGSLFINSFNLFGHQYFVLLQADEDFRKSINDLRYIVVRSKNNKMIPLNSFVNVKRIIGPEILQRFNGFPAVQIMGGPALGYSSGQAIEIMNDLAREVLENDYYVAWTGSAYQEQAAQGTGSYAFIMGIIMVLLILAAQYERWTLPFPVIAAVPFALFGSLLSIWLRGLNNDIYFQIGLLTLIGLAAKNAILIIEFAVLKRQQGASIIQAAIEGAQLRFRPIVMTSLAFILGCLPLAISQGAGSASRHSIGTGVIGGMIAATCLAPLFIPLFYKLTEERFTLKRRK